MGGTEDVGQGLEKSGETIANPVCSGELTDRLKGESWKVEPRLLWFEKRNRCLPMPYIRPSQTIVTVNRCSPKR